MPVVATAPQCCFSMVFRKPMPCGTQNYTFRNMAADQSALMASLGFDHYDLVGHNRRAHSPPPDTGHSSSRANLTVMDIVPTHTLLSNLSRHVAHVYYHWFFLAQTAPFPENMILADPDTYFQATLLGWGSAELSGPLGS